MPAPASIAADPILARFRAALDALYGARIERVVLYGSRARGDHREDSDYDIAVFRLTSSPALAAQISGSSPSMSLAMGRRSRGGGL